MIKSILLTSVHIRVADATNCRRTGGRISMTTKMMTMRIG